MKRRVDKRIRQEKIKEITILNDQLQENQRILEEGRNFAAMRIQTMSEAIRGGFKRGRNDKEYSIIFVSEQFAQMLGYDSPEEFMRESGGTMLGIVHEDDVRTEVPKATKAGRMLRKEEDLYVIPRPEKNFGAL